MLGPVFQAGNAGVWAQDPKADAFSGQGVQVDFSDSYRRPGGRDTTRWALEWVEGQDMRVRTEPGDAIARAKKSQVSP